MHILPASRLRITPESWLETPCGISDGFEKALQSPANEGTAIACIRYKAGVLHKSGEDFLKAGVLIRDDTSFVAASTP